MTHRGRPTASDVLDRTTRAHSNVRNGSQNEASACGFKRTRRSGFDQAQEREARRDREQTGDDERCPPMDRDTSARMSIGAR